MRVALPLISILAAATAAEAIAAQGGQVQRLLGTRLNRFSRQERWYARKHAQPELSPSLSV
eukprot:281249-Chlamydomonas_euryale.AAC.1